MSLDQDTIQDFIQIQTFMKCHRGFDQCGEIDVTFLQLARALVNPAFQLSIHLSDALVCLFAFGDIAQHAFCGYSLSICIEQNVRCDGNGYIASILMSQDRLKVVD
jgi:hypothetical protein